VKTTDVLIQTYLTGLKAALKGADKATMQDALADAEEHLRTALDSEKEQKEGLEENVALEKIIRDYGEPEEIALAYKTWESSLPTVLAATPAARRTATSANGKSKPGFFGVFADPRAWGGLVYMLISIVTGTLYFSWAVIGLSTSLAVMILIIGIPVTILFLLSVQGLAFLEGRLVEAMLGERMPRRASFTDSGLGWIERLKHLLTGRSTWLGLLYMILMLPLGIIYFTVIVALISISVAFIITPIATIFFNLPFTIDFDANHTYLLPAWLTPLVSVLGLALATGTLHLARWVGKFHGKFAKALLVE
jgi:uncharacterized membrane protein